MTSALLCENDDYPLISSGSLTPTKVAHQLNTLYSMSLCRLIPTFSFHSSDHVYPFRVSNGDATTTTTTISVVAVDDGKMVIRDWPRD